MNAAGKKSVRKTVSLAACLILAAGLFAGCASGTQNSTGSNATTARTTTAGTAAADTTAAGSGTTAVQTDSAAENTEADTSAPAAAETAASVSSNTGVEADSSEDTESSNILVVYYSATGNTESVAETIAAATGADLFEIIPVEPYTDDDLNWNNSDSRVVKEHEDESLQDQVELTATTVENWENYDIVFFGYPIWWGNAAWPVNQFVQNNDFTGKTVIPFCTSASSGIGQSGENLANMAGTGEWQEGMRFASRPDETEVTDWAVDAVSAAGI